MTDEPTSTGNALRLSLIAQAAEHRARENEDSAMQAVAERARKLAAKAIAQGKAGTVIEGDLAVIVEK